MRAISIIISLGIAGAVSAQAPPLPECAQTCIQTGLSSSSCDPTDFKCQCSDTAALGAVMNCVRSRCEASQIPAIITAASAICTEYGGTEVSAILSSAIASATSSLSSAVSSRISTVTGNPKTTGAAPTESTSPPAPTKIPNGASKSAVAEGVGFVVALAGTFALI